MSIITGLYQLEREVFGWRLAFRREKAFLNLDILCWVHKSRLGGQFLTLRLYNSDTSITNQLEQWHEGVFVRF